MEHFAEDLAPTDSGVKQGDGLLDAAEMLWIVLSAVSGGDWSKQSQDWQDAAAKWRDNYFAAVDAHKAHDALIQAAEREACAQELLERSKAAAKEDEADPETTVPASQELLWASQAIRSRSNTKVLEEKP